MSAKRYAAKRDSNEPEIITALGKAGATVYRLSDKGAPDLLVGYQGSNYLLEVKTLTGDLTDPQETFIDRWAGQVTVVRTVYEALHAIGAE